MSNIKFSIIIPVYNDLEELKLVIPAILDQDIDHSEFEVFVVDNGSTQEIESYVEQIENVSFIKEITHLGSPYSCRNRGIEASNGEIIVLLDATCVPIREWLSNAKACFSTNNADILGGAVQFRFKKEKPSAAELYDSLTNIKMKSSIETRGVAKTANLFVKREVFSDVGMFEEGLRSGGDVMWTKHAVSKGKELKYCSESIVKKSARGFFPLLKKTFRVGKGQPKIWKESNTPSSLTELIVQLLTPVHPKRLRMDLEKEGEITQGFMKIYSVSSILKVTQKLGNIFGYIS